MQPAPIMSPLVTERQRLTRRRRWLLLLGALSAVAVPAHGLAQGDERFATSAEPSPDGRLVAFAAERNGNVDIYTMPAAGGPRRRLTRDSAPDQAPTWSPDGRSLLFQRIVEGSSKIFRVPAAGGPAVRLTDGTGDDFNPSLSPDGRLVAFVSTRAGGFDLFVAPIDGGALVQITTGQFASHPAFSPDGRTIAVSLSRGGDADLWLFGLDGAAPRRLTGGRGDDDAPRWSADGRRVSFVRQLGGRYRAFSVSATGGPVHAESSAARRSVVVPASAPSVRRPGGAE